MQHVMTGVAQHGNVIGVFVPQVRIGDMMHAEMTPVTTCRALIVSKLKRLRLDDAPVLTEQVFTVWGVVLLARSVVQELTACVWWGLLEFWLVGLLFGSQLLGTVVKTFVLDAFLWQLCLVHMAIVPQNMDIDN